MNIALPQVDRRVPNAWLVRLVDVCPPLTAVAPLLPANEIAHASRLRLEADQARYLQTRWLLRQFLGVWINCRPFDVPIVSGEHGRPQLARGDDEPRTAFSVSHSGDFALIGVADYRRIGVDVEFERPVPEFEDIARHNFTVREMQALLACAQAERLACFHTIWTRKEACLKAIGKGIPGGLDRFEVLSPENAGFGHGHFAQTQARFGDSDVLHVGTLDALDSYSASIAFDGEFVAPRIERLGNFYSDSAA